MRRGKRKAWQDAKPRPGVEHAYPGEREIRFRAALAGARLARFLRETADLAERIEIAFRLDRLNDASDCAEFLLSDLNKFVSPAFNYISALRSARLAYFKFMAREAGASRRKFERTLGKAPRRRAASPAARRRAA